MNQEEQVLVQLPGGVVGPHPVSKLRQLNGFTLQTLVSFPGSGKWAPAFRALTLKTYFDGRFDIACVNAGAPMPIVTPSMYARPSRMNMPAVFFGKVSEEKTWSDRWFPRVAVANMLLIALMTAGWNYQPCRHFLQQTLDQYLSSGLTEVAPRRNTLVVAALPMKTPVAPKLPLLKVSSPVQTVVFQKKNPSTKALPHRHLRSKPHHPLT